MSRRRHTPEQVVRKLREADRLLGEGMGLPEVWKQLEVSEATYHRWRTQFGVALRPFRRVKIRSLGSSPRNCTRSSIG